MSSGDAGCGVSSAGVGVSGGVGSGSLSVGTQAAVNRRLRISMRARILFMAEFPFLADDILPRQIFIDQKVGKYPEHTSV